MAKPDVQLLANGDILVPVKHAGAGWRTSRVTVDDAEYADWLGVVQARDRGPGLIARSVSFCVGGVLVFVAIVAVLIVVSLLIGHAA